MHEVWDNCLFLRWLPWCWTSICPVVGYEYFNTKSPWIHGQVDLLSTRNKPEHVGYEYSHMGNGLFRAMPCDCRGNVHCMNLAYLLIKPFIASPIEGALSNCLARVSSKGGERRGSFPPNSSTSPPPPPPPKLPQDIVIMKSTLALWPRDPWASPLPPPPPDEIPRWNPGSHLERQMYYLYGYFPIKISHCKSISIILRVAV